MLVGKIVMYPYVSHGTTSGNANSRSAMRAVKFVLVDPFGEIHLQNRWQAEQAEPPSGVLVGSVATVYEIVDVH